MSHQAADCSATAPTLKFSSCFICSKNVDTAEIGTQDDVQNSETAPVNKDKESTENLGQPKLEICQRFRKLACQFLKFNLEHLETPEKTLKTKIDKDECECTHICETCYPVVQSFCDMYEDWSDKLVQLNSRTKQIAEIMMDDENGELNNTMNTEMGEFKTRFLEHVGQNNKASPDPKLTKIGEEQTRDDDVDDENETSIKIEPQEVMEYEDEEYEDEEYEDEDCEEHAYKCILCSAEFSNSTIFQEHLRIHNWEDDDDNLSMTNENSQLGDDFGNQADVDHDHVDHVNQGNDDIVEEGEFNVKRHIFNRSVLGGRVDNDDDDEYQFETLVPEGFRLRRHQPDSDNDDPHVHGGEMDSMDFPMGDGAEEGDSSVPQCKYCGKQFKYACRLKIHMRVHTGEKPFECKTCGQRFSQRSSRNRHEGRHTRQKEKNCLKCKICGKRFQQSSTYKIHKLRHHTREVDVEKNDKNLTVEES